MPRLTSNASSLISAGVARTAEVKAIESSFPSEYIHPLAELESWRKEINRPVYHVHKWWANRLGSVFRAIVLAGLLDEGTDVWSEFYRPGHDFRDRIILDPFMGSGTTVGEALKLGCRAVGVDINPVSYFQVRKALGRSDEATLRAAFKRLEKRVTPRITPFYRSQWQGSEADLLYTFWVALVDCPDCAGRTRLFKSWIFASNAYPGRKPESQAVCPRCGEINTVMYSDSAAACRSCGAAFDPQAGPAQGHHFACESCGGRHKILDAFRRSGSPPQHEMYALMLLLPDGRKVYKRPDDSDRTRYAEATAALARGGLPIPDEEIPPGHNTDQARNYNYRRWREMFNDRQLFTLGTMLAAILEEPDREARETLLLLFSGTLEFNNMFCSFKGEGTGAVRHLFHHHILKPERTPLEANPWGTSKSSGSFTTLFERRLMAAERYRDDPFELRVTRRNGKPTGEKVHGVSRRLRPVLARDFGELLAGRADVLLLAGDSSRLPIPDASVDLVVTDPPYFDNVHYSELADFFHCWLRLGLGGNDSTFRSGTSRSDREVQGRDAVEFASLLGDVLAECARVLKPEGLLAFTFHHSRDEAWWAVADAVTRAGLVVVAAHPVKAEMAVAVPKAQAREPINLDLIVVCRRPGPRGRRGVDDPARAAAGFISRYNALGVTLSRGDIRVILMGEYLKARTAAQGEGGDRLLATLTGIIDVLHAAQTAASAPAETQLGLALDWGGPAPAPSVSGRLRRRQT
jgi:putative DNA methylase